MTQELTMTEDETIKHEAVLIQEQTTTQEKTRTLEEVTITQEDTIIQEDTITHGRPQDAGPASSQNWRHHGSKRVKKTTVNCLRYLCCYLPPAKRNHASCKNQAPQKGDPGGTHRTRFILFVLFLLSFVISDACGHSWHTVSSTCYLSHQKDQGSPQV